MKTEWDFKNLIMDFEKEQKEIKKKFFDFRDKWKNSDGYLKDPEKLKEALDEYENLVKNCAGGGNQGFYLNLMQEKYQNDKPLTSMYKNTLRQIARVF